MNIYRTEFFSKCPSNGVRIKYELTIQSAAPIMAEAILAAAESQSSGYHEAIADALHLTLGGLQRLTAHHHGVDIDTRRPAVHHWMKASESGVPS